MKKLLVFAGNSDEFQAFEAGLLPLDRQRTVEVHGPEALKGLKTFEYTWINTFWRIQNDDKALAWSLCQTLKGTFVASFTLRTYPLPGPRHL